MESINKPKIVYPMEMNNVWYIMELAKDLMPMDVVTEMVNRVIVQESREEEMKVINEYVEIISPAKAKQMGYELQQAV